MQFSLTDEQNAFKETARKFAADRLAPDYMKREETGNIDRDLMREMGALGLVGPDLPEEVGGLGVDSVSSGIITEQIAYGDFNVSYIQMLASLMGNLVYSHATPEIVSEWVPRVAKGEVIIGLGLTEPRGGSDAANASVRAEKSGNGYIINGEKTSATFSDQMDAMVLFARTGTPEEGARGVSAFFVPMDEPGITTTRFRDVGTKMIGRGSVFFDNLKLPADALMGTEGSGFLQVMRGFDYSRALIGIQCIAAAQASLDETWKYTTEREAFGAPIAQYQGVSFPLAEAETMLNAARLICYQTLDLRDRGLPHTTEAAMAKWFAPKTAVDVIHQCLLTHGHYGYTMDLPHQQRLRDVMGLEIGDGTAQIMKLIIAREKAGTIAVQHAVAKK
ncbi:MAG: acyl-CoA dehydrogenase family protein [Alphaproteobacteria bacterium]|nr:acyl-CoA dehydrogenase family protein [Alphaproteobacteria bacterium]